MMSGIMGTSQNMYLTAENAKLILGDLLSAFNSPENAARLEEARDNAGSDMLKMMQFVFPLAAEIQMNVIKNYGFSGDGKGATQFALAVKSLEKDDVEIANLNTKVKSFFDTAGMKATLCKDFQGSGPKACLFNLKNTLIST